MRIIVFLFLSIFLICSCGSNKDVSVKKRLSTSSLIKTIADDDVPDQLIKYRKGEIQLINYNDTIKESTYDFVMPKDVTSYVSTYSYLPSVHSFEYSRKQIISVLLNTKGSNSSYLNLEKEVFEEKLKTLKMGRFYHEYLDLHDIHLSDKRLHGIIENDSLIYFMINISKKSKKALPVELLETYLHNN